MAVGIRHEDRKLGRTDDRTEGDHRWPGVLIRGFCRGGAFVAAEALIDADTGAEEEAIRTWLGERGIHVTSPNGETVSTGHGSTERPGS
jgi:hypothetical protein